MELRHFRYMHELTQYIDPIKKADESMTTRIGESLEHVFLHFMSRVQMKIPANIWMNAIKESLIDDTFLFERG